MYYYPVSAVLTECLILSVVEQQDSYGYEIKPDCKDGCIHQGVYPVSHPAEAGDRWLSYNVFPRVSRAGSESIIPSQKPGVISWNI